MRSRPGSPHKSARSAYKVRTLHPPPPEPSRHEASIDRLIGASRGPGRQRLPTVPRRPSRFGSSSLLASKARGWPLAKPAGLRPQLRCLVWRGTAAAASRLAGVPGGAGCGRPAASEPACGRPRQLGGRLPQHGGWRAAAAHCGAARYRRHPDGTPGAGRRGAGVVCRPVGWSASSTRRPVAQPARASATRGHRPGLA